MPPGDQQRLPCPTNRAQHIHSPFAPSLTARFVAGILFPLCAPAYKRWGEKKRAAQAALINASFPLIRVLREALSELGQELFELLGRDLPVAFGDRLLPVAGDLRLVGGLVTIIDKPGATLVHVVWDLRLVGGLVTLKDKPGDQLVILDDRPDRPAPVARIVPGQLFDVDQRLPVKVISVDPVKGDAGTDRVDKREALVF